MKILNKCKEKTNKMDKNNKLITLKALNLTIRLNIKFFIDKYNQLFFSSY